jgi:hypothetical protein
MRASFYHHLLLRVSGFHEKIFIVGHDRVPEASHSPMRRLRGCCTDDPTIIV